MSYIPDCRTDENYSEKYLSEKDEQFVAGFDWAIEEAVDNFFDNNFMKGLDDDSYIGHLMTEELPEILKETYTAEYRFRDNNEVEREVETVADYIRMQILDWCESNRNELIVSMIENMSDKEYEAMRKKG